MLKQDAVDGDPQTGDDAYDMIRYAMMTRPRISDPLPKALKWGSKEWQDQQIKQMEDAAEKHFAEQASQSQFGKQW